MAEDEAATTDATPGATGGPVRFQPGLTRRGAHAERSPRQPSRNRRQSGIECDNPPVRMPSQLRPTASFRRLVPLLAPDRLNHRSALLRCADPARPHPGDDRRRRRHDHREAAHARGPRRLASTGRCSRPSDARRPATSPRRRAGSCTGCSSCSASRSSGRSPPRIVAAIVNFLLKEGQGMGVSGFRDHIVVCGWNATARDLIRELRRDNPKVRIALIHACRPESGRGGRLLRQGRFGRRRRPAAGRHRGRRGGGGLPARDRRPTPT